MNIVQFPYSRPLLNQVVLPDLVVVAVVVEEHKRNQMLSAAVVDARMLISTHTLSLIQLMILPDPVVAVAAVEEHKHYQMSAGFDAWILINLPYTFIQFQSSILPVPAVEIDK